MQEALATPLRQVVLVIDDDPLANQALARVLRKSGYEVLTADTGEAGLELAESRPPDLVITDIEMPGLSGMEVLAHLKRRRRDLPVIIVTGFGSLRSAVEALRAGAADYVTKPFQPSYVSHRVAQVLRHAGMAREVVRLRRQLSTGGAGTYEYLGSSAESARIRAVLDRLARSEVPVLIVGEPGVGKTLAATIIHRSSDRRDGPLVTLDCKGLAPGVAVDGTMPDVERLREGAGGTLLLRYPDKLSLEHQSQLVDILQEVASNRGPERAVRLVATTTADLREETRAGRFLEELHHGIDVVRVELSPLRARPDDIAPLAEHFVQRSQSRYRTSAASLTPESVAVLQSYRWPGNVRELEHAITASAAVETGDALTEESLPSSIRGSNSPLQGMPSLAEMERRYILQVMAQVGHNRLEAARILGINRSTLYRKLRAYDEQD